MRGTKMKVGYLVALAVALGASGTAIGGTYEQNLAIGGATTNQNHMNDPFVQPSKITPVTNPSTWPKFQNRTPADRSPQDKSSKVITIGTGTPTGITYRFVPAMALIVNNYPYFIVCVEGWFRAINLSPLTQSVLYLSVILTVHNS